MRHTTPKFRSLRLCLAAAVAIPTAVTLAAGCEFGDVTTITSLGHPVARGQLAVSNDASVGFAFTFESGTYNDVRGRIRSYDMDSGAQIAEIPSEASGFTTRTRDIAMRPTTDTLFAMQEGAGILRMREYEHDLSQINSENVWDAVPYANLATFCSLSFTVDGEPIVTGVLDASSGWWLSYATSPAWGSSSNWGWTVLELFPKDDGTLDEQRAHCPTWEVDHRADRHVALVPSTDQLPYLRVGNFSQMTTNQSVLFDLMPEPGESPTDVAIYATMIVLSYADGTGMGPGRLEVLSDTDSDPNQVLLTSIGSLQVPSSEAVALPQSDDSYFLQGARVYVGGEDAGGDALFEVPGNL